MSAVAERRESLSALNGAPAAYDARPRIVGPGGATEAVDKREAEAARLKIEAETAEREARDAIARDDNCDRLAMAINAVFATEVQKGRYMMSRKGAFTVIQTKALFDALHDEDAPVVYPQFAKGALGGRSTLPMGEIEKALGTAAAVAKREEPPAEAPPAGESGERTEPTPLAAAE